MRKRIKIWKQWKLAIKGQHRFCAQEDVSLNSFCLLFGDESSLLLLRHEFGWISTLFLDKDNLFCYNRVEKNQIWLKRAVYLLRKRRCRREFENDRKCRKETKERRKVWEGWKHSSGTQNVCPRFLMCVSPVFINQSQAVCCRAGVSCSVIWVSGGMCEPHPTLLEPPTHSISNCKQTASASVGGGTGRRSSFYTVFVLVHVCLRMCEVDTKGLIVAWPF